MLLVHRLREYSYIRSAESAVSNASNDFDRLLKLFHYIT